MHGLREHEAAWVGPESMQRYDSLSMRRPHKSPHSKDHHLQADQRAPETANIEAATSRVDSIFGDNLNVRGFEPHA